MIAAAVIPAAGSGVRCGSALPKQFVALDGKPVLIMSITPFLEVREIGIVVATVPGDHRKTAAAMLAAFFSPKERQRIIVIDGGPTRQESVRAGLSALPAETEVVLVHDAARPFVTPAIIERCLEGALQQGAAIAAVPVRDTLKMEGPDRAVQRTVDRKGLWQAQTPQAARIGLLRRAYDLADRDGFSGTDEASLLEHAGIPVTIVEGSELNFKITRPDDLVLASGLIREKKINTIGHGFDAHRFTEGRPLILGGVAIPYPLGLEGHSDADVLTHAFIDALLGAMGQGDIGRHFPDTDGRYRNISSLELLRQVMGSAAKRGMSLINADMTLICQQPKLAPFMESMRDNLAAVCSVSRDAVNIKATTTEQMGFTGRGEGVAAHAVVLLHRPQKEGKYE
ncbi:MAG TPA: 2-C-methyl-D-erythritol 4-phosphate cytidylyltransferase [Desulfobacteraceae bacterium]|nr:2-C-methyl-D-erythritol 4-phosphate cytidylyltransferase [Desulfobacteraceae bacterium]